MGGATRRKEVQPLPQLNNEIPNTTGRVLSGHFLVHTLWVPPPLSPSNTSLG